MNLLQKLIYNIENIKYFSYKDPHGSLFSITENKLPDNPDEWVSVLYEKENPKYVKVKKYVPSMEKDNPYFTHIISMFFNLIEVLDRNRAETEQINDDEMILCVYCLLDKYGEVDMTEKRFNKIKPSDNFTFCGYDLTDQGGSMSILTDYGYVAEHKAFSLNDLNKYGLVDDFGRIKQIRNDVFDMEDDYGFGDTFIFAIWLRNDNEKE